MPDPITPDPITNPEPELPDGLTLAAALEAKRAVLSSMPSAEVMTNLRLDARTAAGVVVGSLPRIAKHRAELVAEFGERAAALVDDLPVVAYATYQAQYDVAAADDDSDLRELQRDLLQEHQLLLGDLDALANRKLVDRARVDAGRPIQGYETLVDSTFVLLTLFRSIWPAVEGKTPLTPADLERIQGKAQRMLKRLDERQQGSTRMPAREVRNRALTLLVRSYDELRRMLTYVRWPYGDADAIAPSLYARRGRGKRGSTGSDVTDDEELEPTPNAPGADPTPIVIEGPNNGGGPFTS